MLDDTTQRSVQTLLDEGFNSQVGKIELIKISAGWEIAGSGTLWTDEVYAVGFVLNGVRHSRRFLRYDGANQLFQRWTSG